MIVIMLIYYNDEGNSEDTKANTRDTFSQWIEKEQIVVTNELSMKRIPKNL